MRRIARIAVAVLAPPALLVGWAAWAYSGTAPRFISTSFDRAGEVLFGEDPGTRCWEREQSRFGDSLSFVGSRRCYSFESQRQFDGIYIDEFEGQRFLEGAKPATQYRPRDKVWIDFDEMSDISRAPALRAREEKTNIWHVSFVGRRASEPGNYGHLGMSSDLVVVDRVLKARLVGSYDGYLPESMFDRSLDRPAFQAPVSGKRR